MAHITFESETPPVPGGWTNRAWDAIRRHRRRCVCLGFAALLGGYGATYSLVSLDVSPTSERIAVGGGRELAVERWGVMHPSTRVVLVHGSPADASSWDRVREISGEVAGVEWVAVDRLGYGNSTHACETSLCAQARSLQPLLVDPPEHGVILVGHSFGGPVVLRAAVEFPERIAGIVLVAGACDANMKDSQWFRKGVEALGVAVPESWSHANRELLALTDENRAMEPLLDRVRCPVVVIHGTWDPVCPFEGTAAYLRSHLTGASELRIVEVDRALHNLHISHADTVMHEVLRLIDDSSLASR